MLEICEYVGFTCVMMMSGFWLNLEGYERTQLLYAVLVSSRSTPLHAIRAFGVDSLRAYVELTLPK